MFPREIQRIHANPKHLISPVFPLVKHDDFDTFRFFCVVFKELKLRKHFGVPSKLDNVESFQMPNAPTLDDEMFSHLRVSIERR